MWRILVNSSATSSLPSKVFKRQAGKISNSVLRVVFALLLFLFLESTVNAGQALDEQDHEILRTWITSQQKLRSISAEFTQTRALRTLRSPLISTGRLWFKAPNWFRWELGVPPKTIILGNPDGVTIIDTRKKVALNKSMKSSGNHESLQILGMMQLPGGRSYREFLKQVEILSLKVSGKECKIEILPRDDVSMRRLSSINLRFSTESGVWKGLEIVTREGSSIANEFHNVILNPKIDMDTFTFDFDGFQIRDEEK